MYTHARKAKEGIKSYAESNSDASDDDASSFSPESESDSKWSETDQVSTDADESGDEEESEDLAKLFAQIRQVQIDFRKSKTNLMMEEIMASSVFHSVDDLESTLLKAGRAFVRKAFTLPENLPRRAELPAARRHVVNAMYKLIRDAVHDLPYRGRWVKILQSVKFLVYASTKLSGFLASTIGANMPPILDDALGLIASFLLVPTKDQLLALALHLICDITCGLPVESTKPIPRSPPKTSREDSTTTIWTSLGHTHSNRVCMREGVCEECPHVLTIIKISDELQIAHRQEYPGGIKCPRDVARIFTKALELMEQSKHKDIADNFLCDTSHLYWLCTAKNKLVIYARGVWHNLPTVESADAWSHGYEKFTQLTIDQIQMKVFKKAFAHWTPMNTEGVTKAIKGALFTRFDRPPSPLTYCVKERDITIKSLVKYLKTSEQERIQTWWENHPVTSAGDDYVRVFREALENKTICQFIGLVYLCGDRVVWSRMVKVPKDLRAYVKKHADEIFSNKKTRVGV
jgi:hypothetical protein